MISILIKYINPAPYTDHSSHIKCGNNLSSSRFVAWATKETLFNSKGMWVIYFLYDKEPQETLRWRKMESLLILGLSQQSYVHHAELCLSVIPFFIPSIDVILLIFLFVQISVHSGVISLPLSEVVIGYVSRPTLAKRATSQESKPGCFTGTTVSNLQR